MKQYAKEMNIKDRESIMGVLSAYLRGDYYEASQEFLHEYNGL
jgi:hypothetical protein